MITTTEMLETLRGKSLFSEFTDEELQSFFELLDPEEFSSEMRIVAQDSPGDCMYILLSGQAHVIHHKDGHHVELALLQAGDFFGELALVDSGPRSADVVASENCILLKITQAAVFAFAGVYPAEAFKLVVAIGRLMVGRLRQTNQRYIDSLLFPLVGKD